MQASAVRRWLLTGLGTAFLALVTLVAWMVSARQADDIDAAIRSSLPRAVEVAIGRMTDTERELTSLQLNDGRASVHGAEEKFRRLKRAASDLVALRDRIDTSLDSDLPTIVDDFSAAVDRLEPLIADLDDPNALDAARLHVLSMDSVVASLRLHGTTYGVEHFRRLRDSISWQFKSFIVAGGILILMVGLLITLFIRQISLLRQSHDHAVSLSEHLRAVSHELEAASQAVELSNAELAEQNSRLRESETSLARQNYRFNAAIENMQEGLSMFDGSHRLLISNSRFGEMYNLAPAVCAPGTHITAIHEALIEGGFMTRGDADHIIARRAARADRIEPVTFMLGAQRGLHYEVHEQPLADGGWVTTHEDITLRHMSEEKTRHMASHDGLTGLRNRSAFYDDLDQALARVRTGHGEAAILLFDLNRFKRVNDMFGHSGGDHVLEEVAHQVGRIVRPQDSLARLGGDEFAILVEGTGARRTAEHIAERLTELTQQPLLIAEGSAEIGVSVGIACAPAHAQDTPDLIRCADTALYEVKNTRISGWRVFDPAMDAGSLDRRMIEAELLVAIAENDFQLHFQPIIAIPTGRIVGGEALLRWTSPTRGLVSPATVIAIAEESGLILPLGERIIARAIETAANWPEDLFVAINLSPKQVKSPGLARTIMETLATHGVAGRRVEIELTETVLAEDDVAELMRVLRNCGIRFSLDDFGTGYASLSYLTRFPFDRIKIDKSFVRNATQRPESRAIIHTVCDLGRRLGLDTLAEGIETDDELSIVAGAHCGYGQGYFFGRPLPEADFLDLVNAQAGQPGGDIAPFPGSRTSAA